ncbi:MAG: primosomal protein N' [Deltaproteobacteria bacterium]|nr:primosomal protein N' [Deltaproteobacteria bacterium]
MLPADRQVQPVEEAVRGDTLVTVVIDGLPQPLTYSVPEGVSARIGSIVRVELGASPRLGWVVSDQGLPVQPVEIPTDRRPAEAEQLSLLDSGELSTRLKPILASLPAFRPEMLPLFQWMADYYGVPLVDVLETAIPLPNSVLKELDAQFLPPKRAPRKRAIQNPEIDEQAKKGAPELTASQSEATSTLVKAIEDRTFQPFLLFGVTGSGKTEVYIRAIESALAIGKSAIVVVPEIALTPQLFDQFSSRLDCELAVLHSEVGASERWNTWQRVLRGELRVVIGARSAIFAPVQDLGLVIVDEEHETSYKQAEGLRYHARDVALVRGKLTGAPTILGSATPSFESILNASRKRYHLLEMPTRVSTRPLPAIEVVNLREVKRRDMPSENISPRLHELISETLAKREQVIILYNRRGFSSYLQCGTCGESLSCPHCSVTLTYHRRKEIALCHYCDFSMPVPSHCKECRDPKRVRYEGDDDGDWEEYGKMLHIGGGTERVVSELETLFPETRIVQMDRDTVTKKDAYRRILGEMRSGAAQMLVGTQMIAKGHDLPGVTLVGIINADVGLHIPDFRSSEKVYQLITQAAGRAGRGSEPGRVIVQTREPHHPTIVATVVGRFRAFARFELDRRKKLHYPPYGRLMRLVVSAPLKDEALEAAQLVARMAQELIKRQTAEREGVEDEEIPFRMQVLGPAPAPQERLRGRFRFHLLVKCPSATALSRLARELNEWKGSRRAKPAFRLVVDIDAVDML